jgi:hypothetical protein
MEVALGLGLYLLNTGQILQYMQNLGNESENVTRLEKLHSLPQSMEGEEICGMVIFIYIWNGAQRYDFS